MTAREGTALFGQLPISEFGALRESRALEAVMRPTRTILVNPLSAAREYFGTVGIAQMQCVGCGVMTSAAAAPSGCSAKYRSTGSMNLSYVGTGN